MLVKSECLCERGVDVQETGKCVLIFPMKHIYEATNTYTLNFNITFSGLLVFKGYWSLVVVVGMKTVMGGAAVTGSGSVM